MGSSSEGQFGCNVYLKAPRASLGATTTIISLLVEVKAWLTFLLKLSQANFPYFIDTFISLLTSLGKKIDFSFFSLNCHIFAIVANASVVTISSICPIKSELHKDGCTWFRKLFLKLMGYLYSKFNRYCCSGAWNSSKNQNQAIKNTEGHGLQRVSTGMRSEKLVWPSTLLIRFRRLHFYFVA